MEIAWAIFFFAVLMMCWAGNLVGLPGNWGMVLAAAAFWWLMPKEIRVNFHWGVLLASLVLAALGELVEFAAGAAGAKKAGGSKRGAALALVGSLMGGVVGLFVGLPVPVLGQVAAALLFASFGAMGGAMLGEHWKGKTREEGLKVGEAAFWGRLWGTLGKFGCGGVIVAVLFVAMVVQ